jgi:hypothetical protein
LENVGLSDEVHEEVGHDNEDDAGCSRTEGVGGVFLVK